MTDQKDFELISVSLNITFVVRWLRVRKAKLYGIYVVLFGSVAKNLWHRNQSVRHYTFCDAGVSDGSGGAEAAGLRWNIPRTTKTTSGKTPITTNVISPAIRAHVSI